jgi:hypothetical protein
MATVYQILAPEDAVFGSAAAPEYRKINGTNFPVSGLYYDATNDESAYFKFRAARYGSGNVTLALDWYADTASSGDVVWGAQVAVVTPDSDSQDVEAKSFATANTVTDSHLGTTGQRLHRATITISNLDSLAADDDVWLRIYRDADAGGDGMAGDAILTLATLSYSDT